MIGVTLLFAALMVVQDEPTADRTEAFSDDYKACVARDPSNAAVSHCQEAELTLQMSRLGARVETTRPTLSASEAAAMDRFVDTWRRDRDQHCAEEAGDLPGAAYGRVFRECQIAATVSLVTEIDSDQPD